MDILNSIYAVPALVFVAFILLFQHGIRGYLKQKIWISMRLGLGEIKTGKRAKVWGVIYMMFSLFFLVLSIYIYWIEAHPTNDITILPK